MPFYPPQYRRGGFPAANRRFGPPPPIPYRRPNEFFSSSNPFNPRQQQPFINPYEQPPIYGSFPDDLNTVMDHMGTITNGINMMRQIGGIMSLFR